MAQRSPKLLTVEGFARLPESIEGGKMDLVDGEVIVISPVGRKHSRIAGYLVHRLREFADPRRLGEAGVEAGFRLFPDRRLVRAPDVHFIAAGQPQFTEDADGFIRGAPALAIEVTSPDDTDRYLVRPEQESVTVHYPDGTSRMFRKGQTLTSDEAAFRVQGFELPVADIFR